MSLISFVHASTVNKARIIRVLVISSLVIGTQNLLPTPKAEANVIYDAANVVASNLIWDVAKNACGPRCAVPAAVATVVAVNYAPAVAEKTVEYVKPGFIEMFTNWGASFFKF